MHNVKARRYLPSHPDTAFLYVPSITAVVLALSGKFQSPSPRVTMNRLLRLPRVINRLNNLRRLFASFFFFFYKNADRDPSLYAIVSPLWVFILVHATKRFAPYLHLHALGYCLGSCGCTVRSPPKRPETEFLTVCGFSASIYFRPARMAERVLSLLSPLSSQLDFSRYIITTSE